MANLSVRIKEATYENIFVDCPHCHKECVFNRNSDLKTMEPISGQEFTCDNCKKVFWASSDRAAPAKYRWFLEELSFLRINKRYSLYALTLCQTLEMFFYQAIINKMFDRNTEFRDEEGRIYTDKYNQERKEYEKYIE